MKRRKSLERKGIRAALIMVLSTVSLSSSFVPGGGYHGSYYYARHHHHHCRHMPCRTTSNEFLQSMNNVMSLKPSLSLLSTKKDDTEADTTPSSSLDNDDDKHHSHHHHHTTTTTNIENTTEKMKHVNGDSSATTTTTNNNTPHEDNIQETTINGATTTKSEKESAATMEINRIGGETMDLPVNETAATGSSILAIDPSAIEIIPIEPGHNPNENDEGNNPRLKSKNFISQSTFVKMFRGSANYIANHRSTCAVFHIPGDLVEWNGFADLMDDIALSWLLGMNIVIIAGSRHQIDERLEDEDSLESIVRHNSIRVTDMHTLRLVKEGAGYVRFEIERQLARSLRGHTGFSHAEDSGGGSGGGSKSDGDGGNHENIEGNVVSGNFFSAQPFGVIDGVDYMYTGFVRRVEVEKIRQIHKAHDIVLLTNLGVSPSGEVFNVNSESLAAHVAGALSASKIIYFTIQSTALRSKETGKIVQNLRVKDARNLLDHYQVMIHQRGFASIRPSEHNPSPAVVETLLKFGWSMNALEKGVKRAHIIAPANGALLQELYTRDGAGTLISRDLYEGIRRADVRDVAGIYDLIYPLIKRGTLVERSKSVIEKDIMSYYVYTRDNLIVATGQLKRFEGGYAEIGCLVVSKDYRSQGRGDAMLGYLERLCLQCGASKVFVLSTQTMEWFVERGFREVDVGKLPPSRRAAYNFTRRSKIYMKEIEDARDLDASELWWNR